MNDISEEVLKGSSEVEDQLSVVWSEVVGTYLSSSAQPQRRDLWETYDSRHLGIKSTAELTSWYLQAIPQQVSSPTYNHNASKITIC